MNVVETSIILKNYVNRISKIFLKTKPETSCNFNTTILEEIDSLKTLSIKLYKKYISLSNNSIHEENKLKFCACICIWIIYKYIIDDDYISIDSICKLTNSSKEEIIAQEINICKTVDYNFK